MAIPGLTIIGESINDSVPPRRSSSTGTTSPGLLELARGQDERGADWIDVNVGLQGPGVHGRSRP
ncbi:MAG: hypothetical protein MZU84_08410 [Sphingobacterium sp.]|nr:hypothetical protein [Sphingobacterium sp.]